MEMRRLLSGKVILAGILILVGQLLFFVFEQLDGQSLSERIEESRSYYRQVETLQQMTMDEVLQKGEGNSSEVYEKARYLAGFPDSIQVILDSAENTSRFSIFQNADSYSYKNIQKTAQEFSKLKGVTLSLDHDKATQHILAYPALSFFVYVFMIYVLYELLRERDNGMWTLTHATKRGRFSLALQRGIGLALLSGAFFLLLFLGNLIIASVLYGVDDFGGYIQTLGEYALFPSPMSKGVYLLVFALRSCVAVITLVLLSYCIFTVVPNRNFSVVILLGILAAEWQARERIAVFSRWNLLRYVNLMTLFDCGTFDREYKNLRIFGNAVSAPFMMQAAQILVFLLSFGLTVVVYGKSYPKEGRTFFGKALDVVYRGGQRLLCRLGIVGRELWKILAAQRGAALLILLFAGSVWITGKTVVTMPTLYQQMDQIYRQYGGERWGLFNSYLSSLERRRSELLRKATQLEQMRQNGEVGPGVVFEIGDLRNEEDVLRKMLEEFQEDQQRMQKLSRKGITIYAMSDRGYDELMGEKSKLRECVMAVLLCAAAVLWSVQAFTPERKNAMYFLLRSTSRGRGWFFRRKTGVVLGMTAAAAVVLYGAIWGYLIHRYQLIYLDAPIQSLSFFMNYKARLLLWQVLLLRFAGRLLTATAGAACALFLASSRRVRNQMYVPFLILAFALAAAAEVLLASIEVQAAVCAGMLLFFCGWHSGMPQKLVR